MKHNHVYFWAPSDVDLDEGGKIPPKTIVGGKGAGLMHMAKSNFPVPVGFTITTTMCTYYSTHGSLPDELDAEVKSCLSRMEKHTNMNFGDAKTPLLLSVRSGAAISMPGMMDTVLNLGMNEEAVHGVKAMAMAGGADDESSSRFAMDCYRRFIQMYANVVDSIDISPFEEYMHTAKEKLGIKFDHELNATALRDIVDHFKVLYKKATGNDIPTCPRTQLNNAILAVFKSWNNPRAITYRKISGIPDSLGTAVNVQQMVFGNMNESSGTGVGFTRNPSTGENEFYGEYLMNAQGEDVVAGIRTPTPISELQKQAPELYEQLYNLTKQLEQEYKDMQDFEFTIQNRKLFMLQTRNGKRTPVASVRVAVEMSESGMIERDEAILRVSTDHVAQLLHPVIADSALKNNTPLCKGLPASPGAICGPILFTADDAVAWVEKGMPKPILVRTETSSDDIHGMHAAGGILTATGGMTSHAAVVCRGMGTTCVAGCDAIKVDAKAKKVYITVKDGSVITLGEEETLTLDGSHGTVYRGELETQQAEITGHFRTLLQWAEEEADLEVRANADTPEDATVAVNFGACGIGLCRTEHMFFAEDRLPVMRRMILAKNDEEREKALAQLLEFQRADFHGIFAVEKSFPVTIRTLDPPLHEFLPHLDADGKNEAEIRAMYGEDSITRIEHLREKNPMLGTRGCRVGIIHPDITKMQVRAILEAACEVQKTLPEGTSVLPEIMIPLVSHKGELAGQKAVVDETAKAVFAEKGVTITYKVGTMIEVPRACVIAEKLAENAEFISFGTNDLTQTTCALSRDDSQLYIAEAIRLGIMEHDPFQSIDTRGVGPLMHLALAGAKKTRPTIETGVCGEHGGDPKSIAFCQELGLSYVSCSPFRVPVAKIAAAQAAIRHHRAHPVW